MIKLMRFLIKHRHFYNFANTSSCYTCQYGSSRKFRFFNSGQRSEHSNFFGSVRNRIGRLAKDWIGSADWQQNWHGSVDSENNVDCIGINFSLSEVSSPLIFFGRNDSKVVSHNRSLKSKYQAQHRLGFMTSFEGKKKQNLIITIFWRIDNFLGSRPEKLNNWK